LAIDPYRKLDERQKRRVLDAVRKRSFTCESCGSGDFGVGEAMELGHIWFNEDIGTYMVALRCARPGCGAGTGIKLPGSLFLEESRSGAG
jgi:hypothetical protein